ncbi:hypothetical protein ACWGR3_30295 [Streptomyces albidoflavus]
MKDSSTGEGPRVTLNRESLDRLRRANGIKSEAELARIIGVTPTTLWRVTNDEVVPSNRFIAGVLTAFPHSQFGVLFNVETPAAVVAA